MLMAVTPAQLHCKWERAKGSTAAAAPSMLSFGNPVIGGSPPSQGASSDSSDDNGSPLNRSSGPYNQTFAGQTPLSRCLQMDIIFLGFLTCIVDAPRIEVD
nr:uncharacterized protein LOC113722636 [Coffea arabica]